MHPKAILHSAKVGRYCFCFACLALLAFAGCENDRESAEDAKLKELEMRVQFLESRVEDMLDQSARELVRRSAENQGFTVRELRPAQPGRDTEKDSPGVNEDSKTQPTHQE